jgi:UDP-N-acetyl-D-galactosamine dehydrogenase
VVRNLQEFGCRVDIFDPWADPEDIRKEYQLESVNDFSQISGKKYDVIVLAVAHRQFLELDIAALKSSKAIVYDIKSVLPADLVDDRL